MIGVSEHILFHQIIFDSVDDVGGLNNQLFDAVPDHGFHGLFYSVDRDTVPVFQFADDHLAGPGPVNRSVRIGFADISFDAVDGLFAGFVDAGAEAYDQNRFFRIFIHM